MLTAATLMMQIRMLSVLSLVERLLQNKLSFRMKIILLQGCTSLCGTSATSASFAVCKNAPEESKISYNLWYKFRRTVSVGESETVTTTSTNQTLE